MLSATPRGKYVVEVCDSPPCHYVQGLPVAQELEKQLGISMGESTPNGLFTLKWVPCVGACDIGPVIKIRNQVFGNLTAQRIADILAALTRGDESVLEFACVPKIFEIGTENDAEYGSDYSGEAKLVCLSGHAKNRRIFEVRGRTPLREVLEAPWFGGGSGTGRPIKFFQLGGMAGAIGFPEQADVPYCYKHLADKGLTVGSSAIIVMDESVCLVDYLLQVAAFFQAESCGKCTPCRLGQREVVRLLEKLTTGRGRPAMWKSWRSWPSRSPQQLPADWGAVR